MSNLKQLVTEQNREEAVQDLAAALDTIISELPGLTAKAVQLTYAAAKKTRPDVAEKVADKGLDALCDELDPYWQKYQADEAADFGTYLVANKKEVTADLLRLADSQVKEFDNAAVTKGYERFRNKAGDYAETALPHLGKVLEENAK